MIDPLNPDHRSRLATSADFWHRELEKYRLERRETVLNYAGSKTWATNRGGDENAAEEGMWGNLIQMSALSFGIPLAYNNPHYTVAAEVPEGDAMAPRLQNFLNRWSQLIGLGDVARLVALDSFFGFGIARVEIDFLSPRASFAIGREVGPMVSRVSQDDFIYDGTPNDWKDVAYQGNRYFAPLEQVRNFQPFLEFNPQDTLEAEEFTLSYSENNSRLHDDSHTRQRSPMPVVRLVDLYFPHAQLIATWVDNDQNFLGLNKEPLLVRPFRGHFTGPYAILSHLDIPDNLIPVAQSESTKKLHMLFNQLADRTANQALSAKYNPLYEPGAERDVEQIDSTDDRQWVSVSNIERLGSHEVPGPTQSQAAMLQASLQMFKEFSGNLDDTLGLAPTAATATQSELIRQATSARAAEARRRMDRFMEEVGWKIAHLALQDPDLTLRMRTEIPGTQVTVDGSLLPDRVMPRPPTDAFALSLTPESMAYRPAETKLRQLNEAIGQIAQMAQLALQGLQIDLQAYVEMQADFRNLPELRKLARGMLVEYNANLIKSRQGISDPNKPAGMYTRVNQSARTNDGGITQNLTQFADQGGGAQTALG